MIVYLDGSFLPAEQARIPLLDGGYLYGDGVFETVRLYDGRPFDLDGHLARMARHLDVLEYDWRPDPSSLSAVLHELAARNGCAEGDARCRLTVSRGAAPGEVLPLEGHEDIPPTVSAILQPLGDRVARMQHEGIAVQPMPHDYARGNFPGLKTLNYLPTAMALRAAARAGCEEALFVDGEGRVLEAATSNVFLVRDGALSTPPLDLGLLPGRTRSMVMEIAARSGVEVREEAFGLDDLAAADEVFLSGSVKEVVPVVRIAERTVADGTPGPLTGRLAKEYRRGVRDTLGGS